MVESALEVTTAAGVIAIGLVVIIGVIAALVVLGSILMHAVLTGFCSAMRDE